MTELYAFDRAEGKLPETLAALLPPWRRERFERLKNESARQENLCAGLLFSRVMRLNGIDPSAPVLTLPAGKPVFRDGGLYFSLSHSGRYVLCAVSDKTVGADVQQIREVKTPVERRFHPGERAWLASFAEEEKQDALFRLWTRKEAWVKAISAERMLTLSETDVIHEIPGLFFRDYTLPGCYAAAICGADAALPLEIIPVSRTELI